MMSKMKSFTKKELRMRSVMKSCAPRKKPKIKMFDTFYAHKLALIHQLIDILILKFTYYGENFKNSINEKIKKHQKKVTIL